MFLEKFYSLDNNRTLISTEQASNFAKKIADDFNPIHDPDAKRFCVPGDLLFSLVLSKYGLSQKMCFVFTGMVGKSIPLNFPDTDAESFSITDDNNKEYLRVDRRGNVSHDAELIEKFVKGYVAFSGQTFPHILVPLMASHNVMINPQRPLVMYESMSVDLDSVDIHDPVLELYDSSLEVNGKRGDAAVTFQVKCGEHVVGTGVKKLVLSGLREFDQSQIDQVVESYSNNKRNFSF
ncbi:MAG: DUF3581 domain-containing protein [Chromatiales bacterium]|jgi:hypothetical protein